MGQSELHIRQVDPETEADAVRAVLQRNLPDAARPGRHEWLYLGNPAGRALVWIAEEAGRVVGTSAAHPRLWRLHGEPTPVLGLSDFAIDADHRTLGPALKMLRATLEPVRDGSYPLSYDLPSRSMAAIYRRCKGIDLGAMARFAVPLAATPVVRRKLGDNLAAKLLGGAGDAALRLRDRLRRRPRGVTFEVLRGEFGAEFDRLDDRLGDGALIRAARSARYLDWRYARHPFLQHTTVCARADGELAAFAVLRAGEAGVVSIAEFRAPDDDGLARGLLAELIDAAREQSAVVLTAQLLVGSPLAGLLGRAGMIVRDEGPGPILTVPQGAGDTARLSDPANWMVTEGDGDV